jgi:hypothetical protein
VFLLWSAAWCLPAAAEPVRAVVISLNVVLPGHHLPALTERVMKKESVRIWAGEGVGITWRDSETAVPRGERFIRLTLVGDKDQPNRNLDRYVLGDFLPEEGRIRISLFAASRAATSSTASSRQAREPFAYPLALGYILGRAIAHEVGHALLGTDHADAGLMKATFNPRTIAESPSDRFRLTGAEAARLPSSRLGADTVQEPAESEGAGPEVMRVARLPTR